MIKCLPLMHSQSLFISIKVPANEKRTIECSSKRIYYIPKLNTVQLQKQTWTNQTCLHPTYSTEYIGIDNARRF